MRRPLIAGNWKMNLTPKEGKALVEELKNTSLSADVDALICAPATHLSLLSEVVKGSDIALGAQNMYFEKSGAFTGEISADMLKDLGVTYVILGHSERREIFGERDELINKKVLSALEQGLSPILCVGETLEEREAGEEKKKVSEQLEKDLEGVSKERFSDIVIAYEPIWAIGTGKTASSADAEEMCAFIREEIGKHFGDLAKEALRIQYGGSVKPENVKDIMAQENIDGALVGGASLKADSFEKLVNFR